MLGGWSLPPSLVGSLHIEPLPGILARAFGTQREKVLVSSCLCDHLASLSPQDHLCLDPKGSQFERSVPASGID